MDGWEGSTAKAGPLPSPPAWCAHTAQQRLGRQGAPVSLLLWQKGNEAAIAMKGNIRRTCPPRGGTT